MQFNISINQKAFSEFAPQCDIIDAAIFDFIHNYIGSGQSDRITDNERDWFWISYQKIIDENPILGLNTKKPVYRRVQKLIDAGIFIRYNGNQKKRRTYLARGPKYSKMLYSKLLSPYSKVRDTRTQKSDPTRTQKSDDHSTIKDHSTKDHNTGDSVNSDSGFEDFWEAYDKKVGKKKSRKKWERLSVKARKKIMDFIPIYKQYQPDSEYRQNPTTFFNNEIWEDEYIPNEVEKRKSKSKQTTNGQQRGENRTERFIRRASEVIEDAPE